MKKLLNIFLFVIFIATSNATRAANGVDCSIITAPNLPDYTLVKKVKHNDPRLGISLMYQRDQVDILSYISYDNAFSTLDQKVLDFSLNQAVKNILERYSNDGVSGEGVVLKELNYNLNEEIFYLYMEGFNEYGMQNFINQGVYLTSIEKNTIEPTKKMEVLTIGTDGNCIHKVRWTVWIPFEIQSISDNEVLGYFQSLLHNFYTEFKKIN